MNLYEDEDSSSAAIVESSPFYAKPFKVIDFDSYVELDSLSQYFTDLNSYVGIKKEAGKRKLYLLGPETELALYDPLILLDWLPVDDDESILKINPARIKKLEVIPRPYIHGDVLYGGVLSIFTRNEDFGGYKFPESAVYLSFDFYSDTESTSDFKIRNSYEWNPSFENAEEKNEVILKAPEIDGNYILMIQSVDTNGIRSIFKSEFTVE